jgi:ABC-type transporter Mla subunit MlaD
MRNLSRFLAILLIAFPAFAEHDFLTSSETDQVRDVQEPVARIKLYLTFAKQRLDQVQSTLAKNRAGRSGEIRQLLEDYTAIVDAIGSVSDDALARKLDLTLAPPVIIDGEKTFLGQLNKVQASAPSDLEMYNFELKDAIEATSDAIDTAGEDLGARGKEVNAKVESDRRAVEKVNAAERKAGLDRGAESKAEDAAENAADEATKPRRKPPTLLRPGETLDDGSAPPKPKQ